MRLGLNSAPNHSSPEEWADILVKWGFRAASFPVDYKADIKLIDGYVSAARDRDILIAEVGVWGSPWNTDERAASAVREKCLRQFELAEYIHAGCCTNVSGAAGPSWFACYPENYSEELYQKNVAFIRELCDTVKPVNTCFTLEPMQWMLPDSPEQYARVIKDVDRKTFAVHMDMVNWMHNPYSYTHQKELIDRSFAMLGPDIRSCHLKDCVLQPGLTVNIQEVPAGTGGFDIVSYLKAIDRLDPDIPVLLEHLPDMDAYLTAAKNVRKLWSEAGGVFR